MKVKKLNHRFRVTVIDKQWQPYQVRTTVISMIKTWCRDHFGESMTPGRWINHEQRRWYVPANRQRIFVYFKEEADVSLFLLAFSGKEFG